MNQNKPFYCTTDIEELLEHYNVQTVASIIGTSRTTIYNYISMYGIKNPTKKRKVSKKKSYFLNRRKEILKHYKKFKSKKAVCDKLNISYKTFSKYVPEITDRKKKIDKNTLQALLDEGYTVKNIAEKYNLVASTIYKYKREYNL